MRRFYTQIYRFLYGNICGGCGVVFAGGHIVLAVLMLRSDITAVKIGLSMICIICSAIWGMYLYKAAPQLYTTVHLEDNCIIINPLFGNAYEIEYAKCKSIGIGWYVHHGKYMAWSPAFRYIFLSYEKFDEAYRDRMNCWRPGKTGVKLGFDKKTYSYSTSVLSARQADVLRRECKAFI